MKAKAHLKPALWSGVVACLLFSAGARGADDPPVTPEQFRQLLQQNEQLLQQLKNQQATIDALTRKVGEIQDAGKQRDQEVTDLQTKLKEDRGNPADAPASSSQPSRFGRVNISAEGGLVFFKSQSAGQTPQAEARIDEARLFLEAPVWKDVYFYSELDLAEREENDLNLHVGELYLDFENVSKLWGRDHMLNVRAGRFYIPFGEEYLNRFAIDNPLISHSLSDLWGSDNGLELYGDLGPVRYVVAVQNGGVQPTEDFTSDKSVAGRVEYDPARWLHLSVSGMRTGSLNVNGDVLSALWFANGFFRSLGSPLTTTSFHANLAEADAQLRLPWLQLKGAGGYIHYNDNDTSANNRRDVYYYYLEGMHDFTPKFYGAARFSQVFANNGFPIVGDGNMTEYLFDELTKDYWRLSLGVGYRFSENLMLKGEYSFNRGTELDGTPRDREDVFAVEAAFKF